MSSLCNLFDRLYRQTKLIEWEQILTCFICGQENAFCFRHMSERVDALWTVLKMSD